MKKSIFAWLTVIALMMVMAVGTTSFGAESTAVTKTTKETVGPDNQVSGPGSDDKGYRGKGHKRFRGEFRKFFRSELGLTDEQKTKLRELRKESWERMQDARKAVRDIRDAKLKMLLSGKVDKDRLVELDKQYMKYRIQITEERLRMKREKALILTPEQAKRLGQFLQKKRDELRAKRGARGERHPDFDSN